MTRKSPIWYLLASLLAYFALWMCIPKARFLPAILGAIEHGMGHSHGLVWSILAICGVIVVCIPTVAFMAAQISVVYFFSKLQLRFKGGLLCLVGCLAALAAIVAWMMAHPDLRPHDLLVVGRMPFGRQLGVVVATYHSGMLKMLMYGVILLIAASIGNLVSLRVKDKNLLLPVVMFAASIDFWTVTIGPVSKILTNMPEIASAVSAPIPKAGTGAFVPATMMGPGDPLFIALVFAAVLRLGMNGRRNYWFVFVAMTIAMLLVLMGALDYAPALVALAIAVVAANWREFKLTRQEKISTAIVGAVLLASLPLIWHMLKPREMPKKTPAPPIAAPRSHP